MLETLFKLASDRGMKLGLERMQWLDELLGSPSKSFLSIHVGGTNGKGSTTYKIFRALQFAERKVGLYTSPHISTVRERVQVNGEMVTYEEMQIYLENIFAKAASANIQPTFFEVMTLLAFLHFQKMQVDVAVIEVGLGGRLDATNIITPLLSIITSIGYDHMQYLGNSLEEISVEKGGIIKPNIPVLFGPKAANQRVLHRMAAFRESPCHLVTDTYESYDEENTACALKALEILPFKTFAKEGLMEMPSCRFEHVKKDSCDVILDVGHNPCAIRSLLKRLEMNFENRKCVFVVGFSKDKDVESMLDLLMPKAEMIILTNPAHERAYEPLYAANYLKENKFANFLIEESIPLALRKGMKISSLVVVCGTFYIMSAIREALGFTVNNDVFSHTKTV